MKVPHQLQYALLQRQNRFRNKNLNGEVFTSDPFNVSGRLTPKDMGVFRKKADRVEATSDLKGLKRITKRESGRVVKRKGKRSGVTGSQVNFESKDDSLTNPGGKCPYVSLKARRVNTVRRRALKLAEKK